jgi:transposase
MAWKEDIAMLVALEPVPLTEHDQQVYATVIPEDHYLRRVYGVIDFERLRPKLEDAYSTTMGRPPIDPVMMLKISYLSYHYKLSDRQVIVRAETDLAFRWFLGLSLHAPLPNHTNGTHFRHRLGDERFKQVFREIVAQAREHGLVRDRLRVTDTTHVLANAAEVTPLTLAAQVREHFLRAAETLFPDWVTQHRERTNILRATTAEAPDVERLAARIEHLREMHAQMKDLTASWPVPDKTPPRQRLRLLLGVVNKLLSDHADPEAPDRLVSVVDSDARTGLHCGYFIGFMLGLLVDPDSGIITELDVLPANGLEAANAVKMIRAEEAAHGNDVKGLSIDGVGYNGPVLRELTDPNGLNLDVTVPPPTPAPRTTFGPERFPLTVLENGCGEVTCPTGQTTRQYERLPDKHGRRYTFKPSQCKDCPLRQECLQNPKSKKGRSVFKNDYEEEYRRVKEKAATPEYAATRREHPMVERKLGEVARHHDNRHARYRGLKKSLCQSIMTVVAVNIKRIVKLVAQKISDAVSALPVRAELKTA